MLGDLRTFLDERKADVRSNKELLRTEQANLQCIEEALEAAQEAQVILQGIAASVQQFAHQRISSIVTRCLQTVFDEPYHFRIQFEQKRGKTEAHLLFERNGHSVDPRNAAGGGIMDVAAFALRLSALLFAKPAGRRFLILDEPFKMVNRRYMARIRSLIETLAKEMDVQFVIITHDENLQAGKIVEVE